MTALLIIFVHELFGLNAFLQIHIFTLCSEVHINEKKSEYKEIGSVIQRVAVKHTSADYMRTALPWMRDPHFCKKNKGTLISRITAATEIEQK